VLLVKMRVLRQDLFVIIATCLIFALTLIGIDTFWPDAFGVTIAIAGVIGALMVLYEVRLTKQIAQAEFIRDLQSGFASDPNICELWRRLLLKEEITEADRALVSSYLTFFETLHLLLRGGALDLSLTDDLFRNRFFTAIGDKGVLRTALIREAGAFANIHNLIQVWHDYLLVQRIPIHKGYYSYIAALSEKKGYEVVRLDASALPDLRDLQEEVLTAMGDKPWLRRNDDDMLRACLQDQVTLGVRKAGVLVAAAVLYDGGATSENIKSYITTDAASLGGSINLKLVLVSPQHNREGLGRTLVELLEQHAAEHLHKTEILCTIHRDNRPSKELFRVLGYRYVKKVTTPYGAREVYSRCLPSLSKKWAR
jgi:ribosomal protein S18 acetylase RimI-like enzyme